MIISHIVATSKNKAIGKNNQLLWHLPADMKFFKEKTKGHCILTGRKNYESIPEKFRPLPNRTNIVITREKNYAAPGAIVLNSIEAGIRYALEKGETELFIIGGGEIYKQSIELCNKLYITLVEGDFEADTFYPELDPRLWKKESSELKPKDEKNKYDMEFCVYVKS